MSDGDKEEENLSALERWEATRATPPTIFDVIATNNIDLFGAFVLRAFRAATIVAVEETRRVKRVRAAAVQAFSGDTLAAENFLREPHPALGNRTPLQTAVASEAGADMVIEMVCRHNNIE